MISNETSTAGAVTSVTSRAIRSPGPGRAGDRAEFRTAAHATPSGMRLPPNAAGTGWAAPVRHRTAGDTVGCGGPASGARPAAERREIGRRRRDRRAGPAGRQAGVTGGACRWPARTGCWSARAWSVGADRVQVGTGGGGRGVRRRGGRRSERGGRRRARASGPAWATGPASAVGVGRSRAGSRRRIGARRVGRVRVGRTGVGRRTGRRRRAGPAVRCPGSGSAPPAGAAPAGRAQVGSVRAPTRPARVRRGAAGSQPLVGPTLGEPGGGTTAGWSSAAGSPPARPTGSA